ncbi:hypothetical protein ACFSE0_04575 [Ochrobactrum teleogrylli]|uniref:DUF4064 domain-containing protein n=1 Tax=Ochrobactrum teleogrylli TaxID=2479765 RepID=A0ABY2Y992_9HYPH|nr:hypothetical protein [[Ochrobactrum] teleogrylli]TNV18379.1 hypothetical protein FIC94_01840 [[Ochrobactrum] teleogrylli]
MQKAGGIIALVAGIFGVFAAIFTLAVGGMGAGLEAEGASTIIGLGWGGVAFSFLTIILGAVALGARGRLPGILLMICAVAGAVLGGTIVAVFMVLAFIGGLIATLGSRKQLPKTPS